MVINGGANMDGKVSKAGGARPGAGRAKKIENKLKSRTIRVSDDDWKKINENAARANKSVSQFIRDRSLIE